ncbi:MAG TPA: helix-turn-helix transcriptional regulator [Actinomycetota bacterium]|nr:helix-turn-helix transcriptional regulator [Actinomycetota bacterium]
MMTGPTDTTSGSDDPGYYEAVGRAIRVLRTERGLERKELAEASGLSYPYLSEIETGRKRPSSKALFVIAEALGVRPSEVLTLADRYGGRTSTGPATAASFVTAPVQPAPSPAPPPPAAASTAVAAGDPPAAGSAGPARAAAAPMPAPTAPHARASGWRWFERGPASTDEAAGPPAQRFAVDGSPIDPERDRLLADVARTAGDLSTDDLAALLDLARRLARSTDRP